MYRRTAFAIAFPSFTVAAVSLILIQVWLPYQIMGKMMSGMMGPASGASTVPDYVGILPFVLLGSLVTGIASTAYYIAYPEIRNVSAVPAAVLPDSSSFDMLCRFLKQDELRVVEILRAAGGRKTQRDVGREAGLSKLKTHRVLARLAERGVVSVERQGSTNLVALRV